MQPRRSPPQLQTTEKAMRLPPPARRGAMRSQGLLSAMRARRTQIEHAERLRGQASCRYRLGERRPPAPGVPQAPPCPCRHGSYRVSRIADLRRRPELPSRPMAELVEEGGLELCFEVHGVRALIGASDGDLLAA